MKPNVVTFPCEYLFFTSRYEDRLLEEGKVDNLTQYCAARGIIPIALFSPRARDPIRVIPVRNGRINMAADPTFSERILANDLSIRVNNNFVLLSTGIIFQVGNFKNASETFLNMHMLEYCDIRSIDTIQFLANAEGTIDMVIVDVNAKPG